MKYFVTSDIHGFYTPFISALNEAGFDENDDNSTLIICGDLLDRGGEAVAVQDYVSRLLKKDKVILIKGNHESLIKAMQRELSSASPFDDRVVNFHHITNGTLDTAIQLTGCHDILDNPRAAAIKLSNTSFFKEVLPSMKDYLETPNYIFIHGWIPCMTNDGYRDYWTKERWCKYMPGWRDAPDYKWETARWLNGIDACCKDGVREPDKTIVCGHWHASYGHYKYGNAKCEFDTDKADFAPFYGDGIIAIDACTAISGKVNCIVIED